MKNLKTKKTTKKRKPGKKPTNAQIIKALENNRGFITMASKELGYKSHSSLSDRILKSEDLKKALDEIKENSIDRVENILGSIIEDDDDRGTQLKAVMFFLNNKGKKRGYNTNDTQHIELKRVDNFEVVEYDEED